MGLFNFLKRNIFNIKENKPDTLTSEFKYSAFMPPANASGDKIEELAREHSFKMYDMHCSEVAAFNPEDINTSLNDDIPLNSVEKYFLQYLHSRNVSEPNIAAYWTYEYSINYKNLITKLILSGYLEISKKVDIYSLKVADLKQILKKYNLPTAGKKADLIKSIEENIPPEELYSNDVEPHYMLTEKGYFITKDLLPSATKNIDMEDRCISFIKNRDFQSAYKEICKFEHSKKISKFNNDVDWKRTYGKGLSKELLKKYNAIYDSLIPNLPQTLSPFELELKCCIILGSMLGTSYNKTYNTFFRITRCNFDKKAVMRYFIS